MKYVKYDIICRQKGSGCPQAAITHENKEIKEDQRVNCMHSRDIAKELDI